MAHKVQGDLDVGRRLELPVFNTATLPTISSKVQGSLAFDSTTSEVKTYDGTTWKPIPYPISGGVGGLIMFSANSVTTGNMSSDGGKIRWDDADLNVYDPNGIVGGPGNSHIVIPKTATYQFIFSCHNSSTANTNFQRILPSVSLICRMPSAGNQNRRCMVILNCVAGEEYAFFAGIPQYTHLCVREML